MIAVSNVFRQVRIDLKDINEVQYSTWDLENALNKALRLTANHFSTKNTDFLSRSISSNHECLHQYWVIANNQSMG